MKNLNSLSNDELLTVTRALVKEERRLTIEVLWHLHEIQRRRLYADQGYGSLFEYAVKALGYSEAAAGRRIAAMRLLIDVPEAEPKLQSGELTLSTLCTLQNFFQRKDTSLQEKKDLVFALQGKSRRECEKILVSIAPEAMPREKERVVSPIETEIRFVANDALMAKLEKIRELDGHHPSTSYAELFERMADRVLKKLDPAEKKGRAVKTAPPAEPKNSQPRFVPTAVRREIWKKGEGQCTYRAKNGRRCASHFALEIDHRTPVARGGRSDIQNLRLLCRTHNQQEAIRNLGEKVMHKYLRRQ